MSRSTKATEETAAPRTAEAPPKRTLSRSRRLVFIAVILVAVSALTLLFAELFLRVRESVYVGQLAAQESESALVPSDVPSLYYRLKPDYTNGGHAFSSLGFNMPEKPTDKPAGVTRIVFVGDSATQGTGTKQTSQAYPNQVDQLLLQQRGLPMEAWNCGVAGYNAEQVLAMLGVVVQDLAPDVCVYYLNMNDCWAPSVYAKGQAVISPGDASGPRSLTDRIKSLRLVSLASDLYRSGHRAWKGYAPSFVDKKIDYPAWQQMKATISRMHDYCREHQVVFLVGVHPREQFLFQAEQDNLALQDVLQFLESEAIPHLDLCPALVPYRDEELYLPDGDHCTPRGYEIIAEAFVAWFDQLDWSASASR